LQYVILGFGVNLRSAAYPGDLADRATAIETELGRPVEGALVLTETLAAFATSFDELAAGHTETVLARWRTLARSAHGTRVVVSSSAGPLAGPAEGMGEDGALLIRVGARIERIISGEVRWL
jgi:biotin-(acetyl-CoA carboxylase) ligase